MKRTSKITFSGHINQVKELEKNLTVFCERNAIKVDIPASKENSSVSEITFTGSDDAIKVLRTQRTGWAQRRNLVVSK